MSTLHFPPATPWPPRRFLSNQTKLAHKSSSFLQKGSHGKEGKEVKKGICGKRIFDFSLGRSVWCRSGGTILLSGLLMGWIHPFAAHSYTRDVPFWALPHYLQHHLANFQLDGAFLNQDCQASEWGNRDRGPGVAATVLGRSRESYYRTYVVGAMKIRSSQTELRQESLTRGTTGHDWRVETPRREHESKAEEGKRKVQAMYLFEDGPINSKKPREQPG
ncbi:hypothetical protein BDK51DRAFT_28184 [Blyttiomyces helicus]|uniref:Uncharacterized protein n=1 Tax=Blyttiomyces helicus TaxID=388810 RepID=A0A4P9WEY1_9FUNG|nr:hypothetical protein BDK51DRAFT_28184 [Blyttiomyces helicus]|eukprot:RKO89848.1 hypothetical protein BDK51DRAFT_28184 [Blyttiomyces helicus]